MIHHDDGTITKNGKRYGCGCEAMDASEIDGCVIDFGVESDCIYARLPSGLARRSQWTCKYWKPLSKGEQERREKKEQGK